MTLGTDFDGTLPAARAGAEWAWRRLYESLAPTVLRYLRARGAPDPEDVMGEVFLQVVRRLNQFDGSEADFRAWVITIAHHRHVDAWRARTRRPVEAVEDTVLTSVAATGNVENEALDELAAGDLRAAMTRLSEDQREVLFLRILAGLSITQVAAATGKTPGAVKSLQARAVGALRRNMSHDISEGKAVS